MDLKRYGGVLWRHRVIIVVIVGLAVAGAWYQARDRWQPRYRATATILITTAPGQPPSYPVEAVRTLPLAREAVKAAKVAEDPAVVLGGVRVITSPNTSLVEIEVEYGDPEEAARLANGFAMAYLGRTMGATDPDPEMLRTLEQAHQGLLAQARRVEKAKGKRALEQRELHWLQVQDEVVARTFSELWLSGLLGGEATTDAELIERAVPPARPVEGLLEQQARTLGGIGGAALIAALALAFLLEYMDDRLRGEAGTEESLGLPVLATLPPSRRSRRALRRFVAARSGGPPDPRSGDAGAIPDGRLAEAFQGLRVHMDLAAREKPLRTVVVASPAQDGDRTMVALFLAAVSARAARRTVLVSADLRRPVLEGMLGVPEEPGLAEAAAGADAASVLHPTWLPNLAVIPAGIRPAHPADVLASEAVAHVFQAAREASDLVVVDAPPVLAAMEASILTSRSDAVLLILRDGSTTTEHARAAIAALEKLRNGARFLGVVLTGIPARRESRRYNGRKVRGNGRGKTTEPKPRRGPSRLRARSTARGTVVGF